MGRAAGKFFSPNSDEQSLHRRIVPTDDQVADQQDYWNDLAEYLKDDLSNRSGRKITSWLQGSYKFGTQIRPPRVGCEFDIDLGVYFEVDSRAGARAHSAAELKEMVQEALLAYARDSDTDATNVTDSKEFCSRIRFTEDFHIDVPAYDENGEARLLASASDGFVESDPVAIWEWWVRAFDDQERSRARRIVRYLKMWAGLKFDAKVESPPSSIMLTILVAYAYGGINIEDYSGDDEIFAAVVAEIATQLDRDRTVANPVNPDENLNRLGDGYERFRNRLGELQGICQRAHAALDEPSASEIWSEAFEHFFPLTEAGELQKSIAEGSRSLVRAFVPDVQIEVTLPDNGRKYTLRNSAMNVPKGSRLDFRLTNYTDTPSNSLVKWVVRNEGLVAERKNDLGHFAGFGQSRLNELADYKGRHFMDVTVVQHGQVIGLRRVPVSIIDNRITKIPMRRLFRNKPK